MIAISPVIQLCCVFVAWLTLHGGVSRKIANTTLQSLHFILATTIQLLFGALHTSGYDVQPPSFDLPKDIRTIYSQGLEPIIIDTPCCPKCYKSYPANAIPETCTWRRSPRARICGAELWKERRTRKGGKHVPKCHFRTQSFDSWLCFFLSRPEIEDHLEQSFIRNYNWFQGVHTGPMHDIQDSPAWRSPGNYLLSRYHLVFSFYIDWFNPFTNKIADEFSLVLG